MGQLPAKLDAAKQSIGPIGTVIKRNAFPAPENAPAEQRQLMLYGNEWPLKDYGYKDLTPAPPQGWWQQNPGANRKSSGL
jgi:hypothetical protein